MAKKRNKKHKIKEKVNQKNKTGVNKPTAIKPIATNPSIKEYSLYTAILFGIIAGGYLILCSIQSLISYGELGHFYILARRHGATEITEHPMYVIAYFGVLLMIAVLPNLMMYIKEMRKYKQQMENGGKQ